MVDRLDIAFRENWEGMTTIAPPEFPAMRSSFHMASSQPRSASLEQVLNPAEPIVVDSLQTQPPQISPEEMMDRQRLADTVMYGGQELPPAETVQGMQMVQSDVVSFGKAVWNTASEAVSSLFGALEDKSPDIEDPELQQTMQGPMPVASSPAANFQMKSPFGL